MPSVLRAALLTEHGFSHGFSTREGARGDEPENRQRFAAAVGYVPERLFELNQVHGRAVRVVRPGDAAADLRSESGDGLVAAFVNAAHACVAMRTADCVPVLLADPLTRSVAALHAGWRGTVLGVVQAGVQALCESSGAEPARLLAALFPHIRVCCFEVGPEVAEALSAAAPGTEVVRHDRPKPHAALAPVVQAQLLAAGLNAHCIADVAGCTYCEPQRFFSFRRDGAAAGRHLTAIVAG